MRATMLMTLLLVGCAEGPLWEKLTTDTKVSLHAVHGVSATDAWAVGDDGTALKFDGTKWAKQPSGTSNDLTSVWAAATNDVWFVGESKTVLRWNGVSISPVANVPQTFDDVMGLDGNAVFFCSFYGLYRFTDNAFTEFTRGGDTVRCKELFELDGGIGALVENEVYRLTKTDSTLLVTLPDTYSSRSIAAPGPSDIWSIDSSSGSVLRYGSGEARELVLPADMNATGAFARSATDVWLFGTNGYLAFFDGTELELKVAGDYSAPEITSVWGVPGVTFAVGTGGWAMRLVEE